MKVGASQYHPGLTVRWERARYGRTACVLWAHGHGGLATLAEDEGEWYMVAMGDKRARISRRCDAKRAAEVLVGQWWREKCEREAASRDAMLGVVIRGMARMNAVAASGNVATAKGDDLDRLAVLYGVQRNATTPTEYTFRSEKAEEFAAAFGAMANAAREAAESVKGCYEVLSVLENEDTLRERMNAAYAGGRDLPVAEAFRGLPLVVTTIRECGPESGE